MSAAGQYSLTAVATDSKGASTRSAAVGITIATAGTAVPAPWLTQDIGAVGVAGRASFDSSSATYTVAGAGADIWGAADAFRYVYQPLAGDGQIVARVASVQNTNVWVKAGVMIRGDLTPGSPQAMMMVTPGKGNNFQRRLVAGGTSTSTGRRAGDRAVLGEADAHGRNDLGLPIGRRSHLGAGGHCHHHTAGHGARRARRIEPFGDHAGNRNVQPGDDLAPAAARAVADPGCWRGRPDRQLVVRFVDEHLQDRRRRRRHLGND